MAPLKPREAPPPPAPQDPEEAARYLREQPPLPVPRRVYSAPPPGQIAYRLLGYRVYTGTKGQD
jgi:hypothetical protein